MAVPQYWDKRVFLVVGFFILAATPLLLGSSHLLKLPSSAGMIGVGLFLGGMGRGLVISFTIGEAIEDTTRRFLDQQSRISDLASSVYFTINGFGRLIYPVIGGALSEHLSFEALRAVVSLVLLVWFILYLGSSVIDWREEKAGSGFEEENIY